jgi:hypothetical protein
LEAELGSRVSLNETYYLPTPEIEPETPAHDPLSQQLHTIIHYHQSERRYPAFRISSVVAGESRTVKQPKLWERAEVGFPPSESIARFLLSFVSLQSQAYMLSIVAVFAMLLVQSFTFLKFLEEWCLLGCYAMWLL